MTGSPDEARMRVLGLLGIGFDGDDGHQRITRTDNFVLLGGSHETHERMQETAIKFEEALERRGKRIEDAEPSEVVELLHEAREQTGG